MGYGIRRVLLLLLSLFLTSQCVLAQEEINLQFDNNFQRHEINIKQAGENVDGFKVALQDPEDETDVEEQLVGDVVSKSTEKEENLNVLTPLLSEQLTLHTQKGPFESYHLWGVLQNNFDIDLSEGTQKYNTNLMNIFIDAKTREGKDMVRLMLDVSHQHSRPFMQQFIQDAYYETKRLPHHSVLIGNSRVGVGLEGTQSSYTLPFLSRAQISRKFSNVRKFGVRVRGDYKYVDYDLGGYSSDTYFSSFFPGFEFNGWVNLKPLANFDEKKSGKLLVGTGISAGKRNSVGYFVGGSGLQYNYKKFWTRAEYAFSDGSNGGSGLTNSRANGYYASVGYRLTKKLEIVGRFDDFKAKNSSHNREYTAGLNWYLKGQALKLVLNYIFCPNKTKKDSHRILLGVQISL